MLCFLSSIVDETTTLNYLYLLKSLVAHTRSKGVSSWIQQRPDVYDRTLFYGLAWEMLR
jgi:hypothetical protein